MNFSLHSRRVLVWATTCDLKVPDAINTFLHIEQLFSSSMIHLHRVLRVWDITRNLKEHAVANTLWHIEQLFQSSLWFRPCATRVSYSVQFEGTDATNTDSQIGQILLAILVPSYRVLRVWVITCHLRVPFAPNTPLHIEQLFRNFPCVRPAYYAVEP